MCGTLDCCSETPTRRAFSRETAEILPDAVERPGPAIDCEAIHFSSQELPRMSTDTTLTQECSWSLMADTVLNGEPLARQSAQQILEAPDDQLLSILDAA